MVMMNAARHKLPSLWVIEKFLTNYVLFFFVGTAMERSLFFYEMYFSIRIQ